MQGEQKPSSSCCWAPWREWDEDSLSFAFSRNSLLTFSRSLQTFHMWKWGRLFYLPICQSLLWQLRQKAFPFQLHGGIPRESANPPCLSPGLCRGTQKGLSQCRITAMVSPPSQRTVFLLKVIIFMFLIPEVPSTRRILSAGRTMTPAGYNPGDSTLAVPWTSVPVCAGCQGTPQQRAKRYLIQAGKTHKERGRGNQNVNTVILSPLALTLF